MEGTGSENSCSRTLGWLQRDNDAKPWLWKFSNCFSRPEQTLPLSPQTVTMCKAKDIANSLRKWRRGPFGLGWALSLVAALGSPLYPPSSTAWNTVL